MRTPSTSTAPCGCSTRAPYLYFLRFPEVTVVGASPEPMVRLREGIVTSRPIAGSRPGARTSTTTACSRASWPRTPRSWPSTSCWSTWPATTSGRVVRFGTEKVDELMTIERYSHIMHITSQVSGELAEDKGPIDVLRATLPAGTLSGAPKVRAMEIIDELEQTKRGVYGGVVGYIDFSGNIDTAIAIRTMVVSPDGRAHVQAGAGIVADSDPAREDEECGQKVRALLVAVTAARVMTAARTAASTASEPGTDVRGEDQVAALRHGAGAFLLARDVFSVRGDDAEAYLQGQLSQDVAGAGRRRQRRLPAAPTRREADGAAAGHPGRRAGLRARYGCRIRRHHGGPAQEVPPALQGGDRAPGLALPGPAGRGRRDQRPPGCRPRSRRPA